MGKCAGNSPSHPARSDAGTSPHALRYSGMKDLDYLAVIALSLIVLVTMVSFAQPRTASRSIDPAAVAAAALKSPSLK
jgi:hypothetical protein